jgi:hypothetical protein
MLIPLICNQCGGKLEVEDIKVSISGDSFIVMPDQQFECPHCGTKYVSDNTSKHVHGSGGSVAIGNLSFGGDIKGDIVIGTAVVNSNSSSSVKKQKKKWWEFWK